jgi:hypothetical protein
MTGGQKDKETPRDSERVPFTVEATIRRSGVHGFRVHVFDLSPVGCKIEFVERPSVGERVWVKFDRLEALEASVRWVDGHIGGVHFQRPLHAAVFQKLISKAPAED